MKRAFTDAAGILTAWGFMESNGNDAAIEVDDDFALQPGMWRRTGGEWVRADGAVVDPIKANKAAITQAMEDAATARGYDNLLSAISYASDPAGTRFQADGAAFRDWRRAVWEQCFAVLAQVEAGEQEMPTSAEAVAAMPELNLPT